MVESASHLRSYLFAKTSKYALSNVFHYFSLEDALRLRLVCKKMDEACFIGLKLSVIDM